MRQCAHASLAHRAKPWLGHRNAEEPREQQPEHRRPADRDQHEAAAESFTLISGHREDPTIDDRIIADALKAATHGYVPQETRAQSLTEDLRRYLEGRQIQARRLGALEYVTKPFRRMELRSVVIRALTGRVYRNCVNYPMT